MTHRVELRPCDYPYNTLWLIERGQQENHTPTVWYVGHSEHPEDAMYGGRWTENANRAVNFLTRQECETAIFNEFARYKNDPRVNCHASEHVFLSRSEPPAAPADGETLWLWKNGDHMLAFRHLYPCHSPGGDPMVLGEPVARAVFKVSHDRAAAPTTCVGPTDRKRPCAYCQSPPGEPCRGFPPLAAEPAMPPSVVHVCPVKDIVCSTPDECSQRETGCKMQIRLRDRDGNEIAPPAAPADELGDDAALIVFRAMYPSASRAKHIYLWTPFLVGWQECAAKARRDLAVPPSEVEKLRTILRAHDAGDSPDEVFTTQLEVWARAVCAHPPSKPTGATMAGGHRATITGGCGATMTGGDGATMCFQWYDGKRTRITVGYVGEDGIEANVAYRCDEAGKLVRHG